VQKPKAKHARMMTLGCSYPPVFCATVFADGIGHARHMVVAPNESFM
jgi:hypothetical protein